MFEKENSDFSFPFFTLFSIFEIYTRLINIENKKEKENITLTF